MIKKSTRKRGGMFRRALQPISHVAKPLGQIAEGVGKDYIQKKGYKVATGIADDPELSKDPRFLLTGNKPIIKPPKFDYSSLEDAENSENINPNIGNMKNSVAKGGKSRRNRRRQKRRKVLTRKYKKTRK